MESFNFLSVTLLVLSVAVSTTHSEGIGHEEVFSHPMLHSFDSEEGKSLHRHRRQIDKQENDNVAVDKPKPPPQNPLEHLILNQSKSGQDSGASLARVKRQYSDSESNSIESDEVIEDTDNSYEDNNYEGRYPYPYPYPVPIIVGGGFGAFGGGFGRGFGGPGFGGRGFGGRGFGGRGGGFGGRGGGFGGGIGGGRGGGGGRG